MVEVTGSTQVVQLSRHGLAEQRALDARSGARRHGRLVDPVEHAGHKWYKVGLEDREVLQEGQGVAGGVANLCAHGDGVELHDSLLGA